MIRSHSNSPLPDYNRRTPKYSKHSSRFYGLPSLITYYSAPVLRQIRKHKQIAAISLCLFFIFCISYLSQTTPSPSTPTIKPTQYRTDSRRKHKDWISFLVVGDWGVNPKARPIDHQIKVAKAMKSVHEDLLTDFVISVGDHFYDNGVLSDQDPRWKSGFEDIYHPSLAPWYVVMGNHDVRGSVKAQIAYSKSTAKARWIAPSSYYSQDFKLPNSNSQFRVVFLDTNSLMCSHDQYDDLETLEKHECDEMWYKFPEKIPQQFGEEVTLENAKAIHRFNFMQDRAAQISWFRHQIDDADSNVTIKFVFVVGHHALWSQGPHAVPKVFNEFMQPVLRSSNKIIAWFCGHNHALEHYVWNRGQDAEGMETELTEMHQFLSGSGGREIHDMSDPPVESIVDDVKLGYLGKEFGFVSVKVGGDTVDVQYWSEKKQLLHSVQIPFPEYPI